MANGGSLNTKRIGAGLLYSPTWDITNYGGIANNGGITNNGVAIQCPILGRMKIFQQLTLRGDINPGGNLPRAPNNRPHAQSLLVTSSSRRDPVLHLIQSPAAARVHALASSFRFAFLALVGCQRSRGPQEWDQTCAGSGHS